MVSFPRDILPYYIPNCNNCIICVCLFVNLFACLFDCLFVCLFVCLFICLFACLFVLMAGEDEYVDYDAKVC